MSSELKVLQVIPRLGYGGAETGCYDLLIICMKITAPLLLQQVEEI